MSVTPFNSYTPCCPCCVLTNARYYFLTVANLSLEIELKKGNPLVFLIHRIDETVKNLHLKSIFKYLTELRLPVAVWRTKCSTEHLSRGCCWRGATLYMDYQKIALTASPSRSYELDGNFLKEEKNPLSLPGFLLSSAYVLCIKPH